MGFWLSPQQKLVWRVLQESLHGSSRSACLVSIHGHVAPDKIRASVEQVTARHEILRTVFRRETGLKTPVQVVVEFESIREGKAWEQLDLSSLTGSEREAQLEKLWKTESTRPVISADEPALRVVLLHLTKKDFALILAVHPLCADAQSLPVLVRELGIFYSDRDADLTDPLRYVQFTQWQADLLDSSDEDGQKGKAFWSRYTEPSPSLMLPGESRADRSSTFDPQMIGVELGGAQAAAVLRQQPAQFLLSTWVCLLRRLCGQSGFRVGYSATSREYEELENSIGCFSRTLPISARVESDFAFRDVLRQTSAALEQAIGFQEYFSPESVDTEPESVSFGYQELPEHPAGVEPVFSIERLQVIGERYKLRLVAVRRGEELRLEFHYDASRLTPSAVRSIAGYYQNLLGAAILKPDTPIAKLPLLSEGERRQLLVEWNQTAAEYPRAQCLHQLFEAQAARTPERIAVRSGEQAYSYRELNEGSNRLAHYLRAQGVGPDRPVGLCLERSAETMVAVLAILKAGGAYVPLNPDNPPARLKQQLQGAAAVITEAKLAAQIPEFSGPVVLLDRDQSRWANQPSTNPSLNTNPENLVYVIYTSGSTGVPKGVAVRHRNLVNYAHYITQRLELEKHPEGLEFATVSTLGADLGNTCIYPALISGGTLDIIAYETATDPERFAGYVSKHPIDVLKIVPSHLNAWLQSEQAAKLLPRRYLILGGETLTPQLLEKVAALAPACAILNHYGPTETTVGSLTLKLEHYDWKSAKLASIPIGQPIANTQVYILDANLEPVPRGVTGELYIAGAGVSAGYLGQREKTAERFLTNPFSSDGDAKMYRTGDQARYGEDGNIEFLGRGDDQVKVRGFRIELGEIEAALVRHSGVKQAVVLARENENGDKRLLAYVVLGRDSATGNGAGQVSGHTTGEDLRTHLKQQLPDYMVPQAVVILEKLPLTANGKIDRQALPEPEEAAKKTYIAPRTPTELTIAQIWAEVLRRPANTISVDDNFFDLGGHSLMATQVVSRLRQQFAVEIPMRVMFDHGHVDGLAVAVDRAIESASQTDEFAITPVSRDAYRR